MPLIHICDSVIPVKLVINLIKFVLIIGGLVYDMSPSGPYKSAPMLGHVHGIHVRPRCYGRPTRHQSVRELFLADDSCMAVNIWLL
jgi:hypothetical protein